MACSPSSPTSCIIPGEARFAGRIFLDSQKLGSRICVNIWCEISHKVRDLKWGNPSGIALHETRENFKLQDEQHERKCVKKNNPFRQDNLPAICTVSQIQRLTNAGYFIHVRRHIWPKTNSAEKKCRVGTFFLGDNLRNHQMIMSHSWGWRGFTKKETNFPYYSIRYLNIHET